MVEVVYSVVETDVVELTGYVGYEGALVEYVTTIELVVGT